MHIGKITQIILHYVSLTENDDIRIVGPHACNIYRQTSNIRRI